MSTTTNRADSPLFSVHNHHSADCGTPPRIDDHSPSRYLGYFENQHGEQAVFSYDRDSNQAIVYTGDAGGDAPMRWSMAPFPMWCSLRLSGCWSARVCKPPLRTQRRCKRDRQACDGRHVAEATGGPAPYSGVSDKGG